MDRRLGRPLPHQLSNPTRADPPFPRRAHSVLATVSSGYPKQEGTFPRVTHPSAAHPERCARLACVRPAASVRSEPGSNSQVETVETVSLTFEPSHNRTRVIEPKPSPVDMCAIHPSKWKQTAHISFRTSCDVKERASIRSKQRRVRLRQRRR